MTNVKYYRVIGDQDATGECNVHKICIHCEGEVFFLMTQQQYDRWQVNGEYIQNVFPHVDIEIREWMISGTHPECWKQVFGDEFD
jgi:hypothetical protein